MGSNGINIETTKKKSKPQLFIKRKDILIPLVFIVVLSGILIGYGLWHNKHEQQIEIIRQEAKAAEKSRESFYFDRMGLTENRIAFNTELAWKGIDGNILNQALKAITAVTGSRTPSFDSTGKILSGVNSTIIDDMTFLSNDIPQKYEELYKTLDDIKNYYFELVGLADATVDNDYGTKVKAIYTRIQQLDKNFKIIYQKAKGMDNEGTTLNKEQINNSTTQALSSQTAPLISNNQTIEKSTPVASTQDNSSNVEETKNKILNATWSSEGNFGYGTITIMYLKNGENKEKSYPGLSTELEDIDGNGIKELIDYVPLGVGQVANANMVFFPIIYKFDFDEENPVSDVERYLSYYADVATKLQNEANSKSANVLKVYKAAIQVANEIANKKLILDKVTFSTDDPVKMKVSSRYNIISQK